MYPAKSVIYFTTASGAGYGLMVWLAVLGSSGILPPGRRFGLVAFGLAFFLIVSGLMSSTGHLGRPERAWRALSQWRSSWLSREGIAAILSFVPTGLYALVWVIPEQNTGLAGVIGLIGAVLCLITVFATSMIYASLKTIPAWSNGWTSAGYLLMALLSGIYLAILLMAFFSMPVPDFLMASLAALTVLVVALKLLYWRSVSRAAPRSTAESATGLGRFGKVRLVESPHGEDNYLLKEMGYKIARKHAAKLRFWFVLFTAIVPGILMATAPAYHFPLAIVLSISTLSVAAGLALERWLFFAGAKHVVTLYYHESRV